MENDLPYTILKKDTVLYRTAKDLSSDFSYCTDTKKIGKYFGGDIKLPIGIFLEYNDPSFELGVFELKRDEKLYHGKFSYRKLDPDYYKNSIDGMTESVYMQSLHFNISHIEKLLPIFNPIFGRKHIPDIMYEKLNGIEVFLSNYKTNSLGNLVSLKSVYKLGIHIRNLYEYIHVRDDNDLTFDNLVKDKVLVLKYHVN